MSILNQIKEEIIAIEKRTALSNDVIVAMLDTITHCNLNVKHFEADSQFLFRTLEDKINAMDISIQINTRRYGAGSRILQLKPQNK